ncbi:hypothetical protein K7G98_34815, partial [Saccharothrix sp. MB29]|nr:hypothetical protein [Saccharothrix sp. MB29]
MTRSRVVAAAAEVGRGEEVDTARYHDDRHDGTHDGEHPAPLRALRPADELAFQLPLGLLAALHVGRHLAPSLVSASTATIG